MKWKLVPEEPTDSMLRAGFDSAKDGTYFTHGSIYEAMLAAAPQPEHDRMTKEDAQAFQDWKEMDGAIAFHLIERHADGWHQVGMMMDAWLDANRVPNAEITGSALLRSPG